MRIISGKFKGRRFDLPKGVSARPTSDRIRESVFSILGGSVQGANFLDLFSGSGAIGMEALSRGAEKVFFCDSDRRCIKAVQKHLESFGQDSGFELICADYHRAIAGFKAKQERFDIIYMDPPYKAGYYQNVLKGLAEMVDVGGLVLAEHARRDSLPDQIGGFVRKDTRRYGDIMVSIYERTKD